MGKLSQEQTNVDLFNELQRFKQENIRLRTALKSCKVHAENIADSGYGESMDAAYIINEIDEALGEE
ncbi:hypothetical protein MZM54_00400 [[Brevibacterium] frigoritolerans]|nr:hypothetical protein [Peribacillus frigoritolerans]